MEASSVISEKRKTLKVYNGFKFRKDRVVKVGISWRCTFKTCCARIYTDANSQIVLEGEPVLHNHEKPVITSRQQISNAVKIKALDDISRRPLELIREEFVKQNATSEINVNDIDSIRVSIYRKRRSILPTLPKNIAEVHVALNSMNVLTHNDQPLLLINDEVNDIVCFAPKSNLKYLCSSDTILVDGAFDSCAKFFCQMFTLHIVKNGHYVPLVWALLPSKKEAIYVQLFRHLVDACAAENLNFQPSTLVADFEIAFRNASKSMWANIKIVGCRFHLTQAWYRHIQSLGLSTKYKEKESDISKWLRLIFGLPFLNSEEVADCFVLDILPAMPIDLHVFNFAEYLLEYYIFDSSIFLPSQWAAATAESQRTTNVCEAFHLAFSKNFYSAHPNLFSFLEAIKNTQVSTEAILNSLEIPKKVRKSKKEIKQKDFLETCLGMYNNGQISALRLVEQLRHHYAG